MAYKDYRENREEVFSAVLARLSLGESLLQICRDDGMPDRTTFNRWCDEDPEYASRCARAREEGASAWVEQSMEIAEEMPMTHPVTGALDPAAVAWQKTRIAAKQWAAMKIAPKLYGDKIAHEVTGKGGGPIQQAVTNMTPEQFEAVARKMADEV